MSAKPRSHIYKTYDTVLAFHLSNYTLKIIPTVPWYTWVYFLALKTLAIKWPPVLLTPSSVIIYTISDQDFRIRRLPEI